MWELLPIEWQHWWVTAVQEFTWLRGVTVDIPSSQICDVFKDYTEMQDLRKN
jgi:hypothetical protein